MLESTYGKKLDEGLKCYQSATKYIAIEKSSIQSLIVRIYAEKEDASDLAVSWYLEYLSAPEDQTDLEIAERIIKLLEGRCRIREGDSNEIVTNRTVPNQKLAILPGPVPQLIIILKGEGFYVEQVCSGDRFGDHQFGSICLQNVTNKHFVSDLENGAYKLEGTFNSPTSASGYYSFSMQKSLGEASGTWAARYVGR